MIIFLAAICVDTNIINLTKTWTEYDKLTVETAKVRCPQIYPGNECLVAFLKKEELTYQAICGVPRG